jgi:hypothetical protein
MTDELEPGTQILYIPMHADGDENHPDVEEGFVTSVRDDIAFCRYWSKHYTDSLRTTTCSEGTPIDRLKVKQTHSKSIVRRLLAQIQDKPPPCQQCHTWPIQHTTPCGMRLCGDCAREHRSCVACAEELRWERADVQEYWPRR